MIEKLKWYNLILRLNLILYKVTNFEQQQIFNTYSVKKNTFYSIPF